MEKLNQILSRHLPHFKSIEPGCSIRDALCRMSTQNTDYLIVMDEKENFMGLITEHDVARKALFMNKSLNETRVKEMMNTMKKRLVRFLPVFRNMSFIGIVSADDILEEAVRHRGLIFD